MNMLRVVAKFAFLLLHHVASHVAVVAVTKGWLWLLRCCLVSVIQMRWPLLCHGCMLGSLALAVEW
jgi:hypothetical protein